MAKDKDAPAPAGPVTREWMVYKLRNDHTTLEEKVAVMVAFGPDVASVQKLGDVMVGIRGGGAEWHAFVAPLDQASTDDIVRVVLTQLSFLLGQAAPVLGAVIQRMQSRLVA